MTSHRSLRSPNVLPGPGGHRFCVGRSATDHAVLRDCMDERTPSIDSHTQSGTPWLRQLVGSDAAYAIIVVDSAGTITHWLGGAERYFGYSTEEAMGMEFGTPSASRTGTSDWTDRRWPWHWPRAARRTTDGTSARTVRASGRAEYSTHCGNLMAPSPVSARSFATEPTFGLRSMP